MSFLLNADVINHWLCAHKLQTKDNHRSRKRGEGTTLGRFHCCLVTTFCAHKLQTINYHLSRKRGEGTTLGRFHCCRVTTFCAHKLPPLIANRNKVGTACKLIRKVPVRYCWTKFNSSRSVLRIPDPDPRTFHPGYGSERFLSRTLHKKKEK
jgi:hypothetical protein